nr:phage tail tip lysozyme [Lentilactobacillus hilgardii]
MNSSTGYGIAQFTPAGKIKVYADKVGKAVSDINVQLDYIWNQVTATGGFYGGSKSLKQFAHDTDPKVAALDFLQGYEMHSASTDALADRQKNAETWWAIYNKENAGTYGDGSSTGGTTTSTPDGYTIQSSGTFTFNTNCKVRNKPLMSNPGLATYKAGQAVNYDQKEKNDDHYWLSYLGSAGTRHYVPYANISKGTYFGTDTLTKHKSINCGNYLATIGLFGIKC